MIERSKLRELFLSSNAITIYVTVLVGGLVLGVYYVGRFRFGIPTVLLIFYLLSFAIGLGFLPLFAWTIGPSLGAFVPETLANLIFIVSMVGVRRGVLEQRETDEYVIRRGDAGAEPRSYWTRWALAPFAITFEATPQAFGDDIIDEERREELKNLVFDSGRTAEDPTLDRGDQSWFVKKSDLDEETMLIPIGQKLAELRNAAGTALNIEAYTAALGEHGGDTSGSSNRLRLIGTFVFVILGAILGWGIHF